MKKLAFAKKGKKMPNKYKRVFVGSINLVDVMRENYNNTRKRRNQYFSIEQLSQRIKSVANKQFGKPEKRGFVKYLFRNIYGNYSNNELSYYKNKDGGQIHVYGLEKLENKDNVDFSCYFTF